MYFIKRKKTNSVILNYDENSTDLFYWYQQLVAESLGKKNKGLFPVVSSMPKDNHSLMQLYLSGPQNNFFTFFYANDSFSKKIENRELNKKFNYLKNKSLNDIKFAQFNATQSVFKKRNIPFRSFLINKKRPSPMGGNISAYNNSYEVERVKKSIGGTIYKWDILLTTVNVKN